MSNNNITNISGLHKKGNAWKTVAEGGTEEEARLHKRAMKMLFSLLAAGL